MAEFKRYQKYLVLKIEDIEKYLDKRQRLDLGILALTIYEARLNDGKKNNLYVVVNEDEPYAEEVWQLIQRHVKPQPRESLDSLMGIDPSKDVFRSPKGYGV